MKTLFSIIIFAFCSILISCEKRPDNSIQSTSTSNQTTVVPTQTKTVYVSSSIKEWGLFQIGSYWIVKDSVTSNIDSIYIIAINTQTVQNWVGDTNFIEEQIVIDFSNYSLHKRHHLSSFPKDNIKVSVSRPNMTIFQTDTSSNNSFGLVNFKYFPLATIAGANYTDILREYHAQYIQQPNHTSALFYEEGFWKKHVGLLKLKQQGGQFGVKEVIRYNVIQ